MATRILVIDEGIMVLSESEETGEIQSIEAFDEDTAQQMITALTKARETYLRVLAEQENAEAV